MAIGYSIPDVTSIGARNMSIDFLTLDNSYPNAGGGNGGYPIDPVFLGLVSIEALTAVANDEGIVFQYNTVTGKLQAFIAPGAGGGVTGATSGGTPAGTNGTSTADAQVFTGSALAGHVHSFGPIAPETVGVTAGTGVSAALTSAPVGSVENVFIAASGGAARPAILVPPGSVANTSEVSIDYTTGVLQFLVADAVTSAVVIYSSNNTTSVSAGTPAGTNGTSSVSAQVFTGAPLATHTHTVGGGAAGALSEVANGTDLSGITALQIIAIGQ
jgi:hypothetical protein